MSKERIFPDLNSKSDVSVGLASPRDRLASLILDVTLLLPLVQFCQSPVKKWILESLLFYKGSSAPIYELINLLILGFLFVIYFTVTHYFFGQSIGKLFFKIKVISYHGRLTWMDAFLRSVFVLIEFACLGLPFLALFSHPLRRSIHDRISDTLVIALDNPVGFPQITMKWKVGLLFGSLMGFLFLSTLLYYSIDDEVDLTNSVLIFDKKICDNQFTQVNGSLSSMIELYLVKKLNSECLFNKAREALWENENKSMAQLAMALAFEDDKDQSDQYLESVCERGSDEKICEFSQWLLNERKESNKSQLEQIALSANQEDFIKVFAAAYFRNKGEYKKVEEILSKIQDKKQLEPLLASLSFQSYLGQLRVSEALALYKTHSSLNEKNLSHFIRFEMRNQSLSLSQQVQVLETFYPQLIEKKQERSIASKEDVPMDIMDLYNILKEAL